MHGGHGFLPPLKPHVVLTISLGSSGRNVEPDRTAAGSALVGASVSPKSLGEMPTSSRPWPVRAPRPHQNLSSGGRRRLSGNLAQRLLENFHGLSALNQIFVVDDDRGYGADTALAIELFALANLVGIET